MALAPRQPGSTIKPFTYLAAFEMPAVVNTDPAAMKLAQAAVDDEAGTRITRRAARVLDTRHGDHGRAHGVPYGANPPYVPTNYYSKEHGLVSVRTALGNSYNIPAVKTLEHAGLERLKDVARRAGITTLTRPTTGCR